MRTVPTPVLVVIALAAAAAAACGATDNPRRPKEPSAWTLSLRHTEETPATVEGGPRAEASGVAAAPGATPGATPGAAGAAGAQSAQPNARPDGQPSGQAAPAPAAGSLVVATVSGRPIEASELLARLYSASPAVQDEIVDLIMEQMIELEAARHGVEVDPEDVDRAYDNAVRTLTREIARNRPGTTLDEYVQRGLGLDPETYRARLRRRARQKLVGDRVLRMHLLTHEHAWARMIVVASEAKAEEIRAELAQGADFAELARAHSIDLEDVEARGRLEPVLKAETLMARLAFEATVGEVVGPTLERGAYLLLLVEERPEPLAGRWPDVAAAVEESLVEHPVGDLEIRQWKDAMERRYEIDLSPFLRMVGALPPDR